MTQMGKRLNRFSRLDTIVETTERVDSVLSQTSVASSKLRESVDGEKMQDLGTTGRTGIALSSARIRNRDRTGQKEHKRSTSHSVSSA